MIFLTPFTLKTHLECGYRVIARPATTATATARKADSLVCFCKYVWINGR